MKLVRPSIILLLSLGISLVQSLGPAYGGDKFVRFKELPPAHVSARVSGSVTLTCSATGSPSPVTGWYKNGHKVAGSESGPGGLGESVAKLVLSCVSEEDGGVYECRSQAGGQEVVVSTKVDIVGHKPLSPCLPRSLQGGAPTITGWFSTIMIQSGESVRYGHGQWSPIITLSVSGYHVMWRATLGAIVSSGEMPRVRRLAVAMDATEWRGLTWSYRPPTGQTWAGSPAPPTTASGWTWSLPSSTLSLPPSSKHVTTEPLFVVMEAG